MSQTVVVVEGPASREVVLATSLVPLTALPTNPLYTHVQSTPAASWQVLHNRGLRPIVQVLDDQGSVVWADVVHVNQNELYIHHGSPMTGSAILM